MKTNCERSNATFEIACLFWYTMLHRKWLLCLPGALVPLICSPLLIPSAHALTSDGGITFSLDPASETLQGGLITPDDVVKPGPAVQFDGAILGLNGDFPFGLYDNLNALSYGRDPIVRQLFFSVDRVAVGVPGTAVHAQAAPGVEDASADIYKTNLKGDNTLVADEQELGLVPGFFGDDIDALDVDTPLMIDYVYFSVDDLSLTHGDLQDTIMCSAGNGSFDIFANASTMGFHPDSDLDALVLLDRGGRCGMAEPGIDVALFSLSTFSPDAFTFTGNPYIPGMPGYLSPADVLITTFDGSFHLYAAAEELGLLPDDELDALDTAVPGPLPIFGVTTAFAYSRKLRRRQRSTRLNSRS